VPAIPLKLIPYEDAWNLSRLVDTLNYNFRMLDWLLKPGFPGGVNLNLNIKGADDYGIDPEYIKFYPNQCWNSSFEAFDSITLQPKYWETDGSVSADTSFDGIYSLKLAPGQYAQQKKENGAGLADPYWWSWCPETRISFRVKGEDGKVEVKVIQGGDAVPLWAWMKDAKGNWIKSEPNSTLTFDAALDWPMAFRTFAAQTSPSGGKIILYFRNVGSTDVYIDAVTIEPDWTGRWPSFYTHGPGSLYGSDVTIEYKRVPYQQDITINFSREYPYPPVVTAGIAYDFGTSGSHSLPTYDMTPHIDCLINQKDGINWYYGVRIVWANGPSSISNAYTTMIAVCRG